MKVLENTPAVLSLGNLCDENGYSYEWINGQKPHLIKDGIRIICNTENFVLIVVPGLSSSSSGSSSTYSSTVEKSGRQRNQDLRCQSGPSAKDSVIFSGGDDSKNYGADQQRLQISDLHFDKFLTPATFSCWKIRFKTEVCACSKFLRKRCNGSRKWSWLIQWVNWDLRHLLVVFQCLILKYLMRGLLQHWTKSSIIPSSKGESVWRNKRPRRRTVSFEVDRLPTWSTNNSGSLEPMILSKTTPTCSLLFYEMMTVTEFDSKWDGILLSMTKIPPDDILEGLYKWRIRKSEKLKTVLQLYDLETYQKKLEPDYHRLQTMVKRSIEQEIRNKNFGARSGNFEKDAVVKNQGTKQRVQRILGDCWQWKANGQCSNGDHRSFRHVINMRAQPYLPST